MRILLFWIIGQFTPLYVSIMSLIYLLLYVRATIEIH